MLSFDNEVKSATFKTNNLLCGGAIHAVNAVLWQPGEQIENNIQTDQQTTIPVAAHCRCNESTAGADASVKSLKLYDMKQYLSLLSSVALALDLYNCAKSGK